MANKESIECFHCSLCHDCMLGIIWKLNLSPTVPYEDCDFPNYCACTCYFELPSAWARQQEYEILLSGKVYRKTISYNCLSPHFLVPIMSFR